jgi:hypothetical protein
MFIKTMTRLSYSLFDVALFVTTASSTYLLWIGLHFLATQTYVKYCVGSTWIDVVFSIFYVSTPFCQGVSWVIYHGSRNMYLMWFVLGTFLSRLIVQYMYVPHGEIFPKVNPNHSTNIPVSNSNTVKTD